VAKKPTYYNSHVSSHHSPCVSEVSWLQLVKQQCESELFAFENIVYLLSVSI